MILKGNLLAKKYKLAIKGQRAFNRFRLQQVFQQGFDHTVNLEAFFVSTMIM